jgi:hypothetical protein
MTEQATTNTQGAGADQEGLEALDQVASAATGVSAEDIGSICQQYQDLKPKIETALSFVERIPVYGSKIASVIRFLMGIADIACPVNP